MLLKKTKVFAMICCLAVLVMACTNKKGTDNSASPSDSVSPSVSASASASQQPTESASPEKKLDIGYLGVAYGPVFPADGKGIAMINERFNINYTPTFVPDAEYEAKITALMASNDMPDIARLGSNGANYAKWAKQGGLLALDDYIANDPELQKVPESIWAQLRVDGKIYAIPKYFPSNVTQSPVIRKDWLDKLGLQMPTNYEELKKVAIAFTKNDPDGNSKNDTVGMSVGSIPDGSMGAYWLWWHYYPDKNGQFIPNAIGEGRKQVVQFFADLYREGAIAKNFATKKGGDVWMDFWSGKAGIYSMQPYQPGTQGFDTLLAKAPNAEVVAIPAFNAPDGTQGYAGGKGWYDMTIFNAKLADDPDKVKKILDMLKTGRQFIPMSDRNPGNAEFDWLNGKEGAGYTIVDGKVQTKYGEGHSPLEYLPDSTPWAPSAEALELDKEYTIPKLSAAIASLMQVRTSTKSYLDPYFLVSDDDYNSKWYATDGFEAKITTEQVKMIMGKKPMSDWDKMVEDWKKSGAQALYEGFAKKIADAGATPQNVWQ